MIKSKELKKLLHLPQLQFRPGLRHLSNSSVALRLFLTCWLVYTAHFATNTVREIFPALTLGDHLSFDVSDYLGFHPDIFELPGRGAYINNNPGASILGAIPYTLTRPVIDPIVQRVQQVRAASEAGPTEFETPFPMRREFYRLAYQRGVDVKFGLAAGVMQAFLMAPISALSVVVMFYVLLSLTNSKRAALALALLYAFATPIFYRTAQLNHNLLLSHFAFFAFVLLWQPWENSLNSKRPAFFWAGLLSGWTVVLDYSGLVVVLVLGIYAIVRWLRLPGQGRSRSDLVYYSLGVVLAGTILIWYQWSSFGHPIYPAQHYMPSTQFSTAGYSGIDWPSLDLLWRSAFGIKFGLFAFAPILVLALYIPGWFNNRIRIVGGPEIWYIIGFTVLFFLFSAANRFGYMQFNTGVRHIVPVVPPLFLLAAGVLLWLPPRLTIPMGAITTYWSWALAMYREVGDGHPLGVIDAVRRVTFEGLQLPWLTTLEYLGYISSRALTIPVMFFIGVAIWIMWSVRIQAAKKTGRAREQSLSSATSDLAT